MINLSKERNEIAVLMKQAKKDKNQDNICLLEERLRLLDRIEAGRSMDFFLWVVEITFNDNLMQVLPLKSSRMKSAEAEALKIVKKQKAVKSARLYSTRPEKIIL